MSAEKPEDKKNAKSPDTENQEPTIYSRSEALKKAITKLKTGEMPAVDRVDTAKAPTPNKPTTPSASPPARAKSNVKPAPKRAEPSAPDSSDLVYEVDQATERIPVSELDPQQPPSSHSVETAVAEQADKTIPSRQVKQEPPAASWELPTESDTPQKEVVTATPVETPPADDKSLVVSSSSLQVKDESAVTTPQDEIPWTLQQFFDGEIDLDVELSKRFPSIPLMTTVKFRTLGAKSGRRVATIGSADGMASLIVDADIESKIIQLSFTYGSMMTLRYGLVNLSAMDRSRWLDLMRRDEGGLAFLWGPTRWQDDYLICIARKNSTNIYAFSPNHFESSVRLTPQVATQLLDWIDEVWTSEPEEPDDDSPLLTW